jgi:GntR family transcriptional regulator/MocR family aminotransferase
MTFHVSLVGRRDLSGEIYRQMRGAILEGRLGPGAALPASRELARTLSVSRMTVTVAYERLAGEGFVDSRVGAGTFVNDHAARQPGETKRSEGALSPRALWARVPLSTAFVREARYDFRTGLPAVDLFPHRTWRRLVARSLRSPDPSTTLYTKPAGLRALREAIARHIGSSRGIEADPDDVIVTNGTQQALDLLARVLLAPGERIAVEDPGYKPPRLLFESLGLRVQGVRVDSEGLVVDELSGRARAVYVTPSHQYPLGMAMSLPRRQALLAWAERHDAAIIEDDYDSEFRFGGRPLEPLHTLDGTGRVVYVGSFSKTMLPALRLGFVLAPRGIVPALQRAKYVSDWHTPTLIQTAVARFIEEGAYARHLRKVSSVYEERHGVLLRAIERELGDELTPVPSTNGLHVAFLAKCRGWEDMTCAAERAANLGVACQPLSGFAVGEPRAGILLGYGAISVKDIPVGVKLLSKAIRAR